MSAIRIDPSLTVGKTKRRVISIGDDAWEEIMTLAAIRRVSASYVVRCMLEEGLAQAKADGEFRTGKRRARKALIA